MWLYLPSACVADMEDLNLDSRLPDLPSELSVSWRGKPMQLRTWSRLWNKGGWLRLLSGVTLRPLTRSLGLERWIASLPDSPVSRSLLPAKGSTQKTSDGSGTTLTGFFASYDPSVSSSWRTSQASLFADWDTFSERWPSWVSMRRLECFERQMPALLTAVRECSSSRLTPSCEDPTDAPFWPTPDAGSRVGTNGGDWAEGTPHRAKAGKGIVERPTLAALAQMWPTATVGDSRSSGRHTTKTGVMHAGTSLTDAMRTWPTPAARDYKGTNSKDHVETATGRAHMDQLPNFVAYGLQGQTTATDGDDGSKPPVLNPDFVEALMGLEAGWTSCASLVTASSRSKPPSLSESSPNEEG